MQRAQATQDDRASAVAAPPHRTALAWAVHLFTASGAVVGTLALIDIGEGNLTGAALLMMAAFAIDAADGALARAVGVSQLLPQIDGRRLDDLVDFLNYVVVPTAFMIAAGTLPHWSFAALPVLSSCYGFAQTAAKTEDDFFLGFPSLWNLVAIYAWGFGLSPTTGVLWVVFLSAMVFVPLKYAYPSKLKVLRTVTVGLGVLWGCAVSLWIGLQDRVGDVPLLEISLVYPAYYFALSFWLGGLHRKVR
ncbi:MAG: CDP-alcohol phosphatidyltransferase family protein [Myxococcota bacterium]